MAKHWRVAIIPDFAERYDRMVMDGISQYVHERGNWSLYIPTDAAHRAAQLRSWKGDGIIASFDNPALLEVIRRKRLPTVGFGGGPGITGSKVLYLATDDATIGQMGAEHFLERGFTSFGYCAMPLTPPNQPWSERRRRSFCEAITAAGHKCSVFRAGQSVCRKWDRLLEELCRWLDSLPKPVGVMAAYDVRALHVLEACRELQVKVPDDVAVLGVDNDEQVCELSTPPLSSIIQGGRQLGLRAATWLDALMSGRAIGNERMLHIRPEGVVTRQSTDILAITDPDVSAALKFIREHAFDGIRVADVVRHSRLSRVSLEGKFKQSLGRTMHREIKRVQLERVKTLLRKTDLPIHSIASQTGFEYPEYLSNFFHRETGRTLGQFRIESRA